MAYNITFQPNSRSIDIISGTSLLEAAWVAGINLSNECGGKGKCGRCKIIIIKGKVSPPDHREKPLLTEEELRTGHRLACCTYAESDLEVDIPEGSLSQGIRLQVEGLADDLTVDPVINAFDFKLKAPSLEEPMADIDRVIGVLKKAAKLIKLTADINAVAQLPPFLREHEWQATCFERCGEIIGFAPRGTAPLGIAVDLGTTKIAAYLLDLTSGKELASLGCLNPQTRYGDDVISRLHAQIKHKNSGVHPPGLTRIIRESLGKIIKDLTERAGVMQVQVADLCIAGNTAMTHLLLDLPVRQLAASPYVAAVSLGVDIKARELGLTTSPGAYVHVLPGIGGFVGPDHVAMILGSDIDKTPGTTLGIDIGTNTEIVISRPDLPAPVSLSCPSGPVFEGAHVAYGMRAAKGAIESVELTEKGVEYRTIGDAGAVGLCGSGIIDAVSELYKWGLINERGRFVQTNPRVKRGRYGGEFQLVPESGNHGDRGVAITQKDIDQVQVAKGALRAGIEALMEETGTSPESVSEVIIAGAFGSFINIVNAIEINMLPYFPHARYRQIGNGAGTGIKRVLVSRRERIRAQNIASSIRYLELTAHPGFSRRFASGMMFPKDKKGS